MAELNTEEKTPFHFAEGQLLLVDKPYEWTSFDVVGKLRNTMKPRKIKVGHAGTLDPLATGLLIICTGKMTKQIDSFQAEDKEYTGTITLGATTPTFDLESDIDQTFDISAISEDDIYRTAASFVGTQDQYPPAHSAIKIDGERLYEKARRGETVVLKPRQITVHSFEIEKMEMPVVYFRIKCTKGTYIRSIANDFGQRLQNGSYLSGLRRTKSGDFRVEDAWNLPDLILAIKSQQQEL